MPLWIVSSAGQRQRHPLEPAAFELALHAQTPALSLSRAGLDFHDDRRVRHAELLGEHDADLAEALVVGLQAGQHEVELLVADRAGQRLGDDEGVGGRQRVRLDVDRAVGAARQRLAQHLRGPRRAGRARRPPRRRASPSGAAPPRARRRPARSARSWRPGRGSRSSLSFTRSCHSRVTTCLMQTAIFIGSASAVTAASALTRHQHYGTS